MSQASIKRRVPFTATILAAELFALSLVQAQGTLYVSNLGQTPTGNAQIGSDSWLAQGFSLGPGTNTLNSVELLLNAASGNPSGFTVSICLGGSSGPGPWLGKLSGSTNPLTGGIYTYTTPGIPILPTGNIMLWLPLERLSLEAHTTGVSRMVRFPTGILKMFFIVRRTVRIGIVGAEMLFKWQFTPRPFPNLRPRLSFPLAAGF